MLDEILKADVVLITAGAGIGVDSGLPDFRGTEGFWREYPLLKNKNISFEEIANPMQFEENPYLAWSFYGHRHDLYKETIPHEGFHLLLELAESKKDYFVVTSNVDGQFQKAGFDQNHVYEIHGTIFKLQCTKCDNLWDIPKDQKFNVDKETLTIQGKLPYCSCGELARPNIMMFMDMNFNDKFITEQYFRFKNFLKNNNNLVIIEIGAGTAIPSIRHIGETLMRNHNFKLIRINPRDFHGPKGTISFPMGGLEGIKHILK